VYAPPGSPTGAEILPAGIQLRPQEMGLAASVGIASLLVYRKLKVATFFTGDEIVMPGEPLRPGQIYNSNRILIRSIMAACPWAEIVDFGILPDRQEELATAFGEAALVCDVLVSTGGVSAGDEDHVVSAVGHNGGKLDVLKVAMRPGKPLKIGRIGGMLFAGLPGNPNATLITFRQIALPAIRKIAGLHDVSPAWIAAVSGFAYDKLPGRTEFVPVRETGRDPLGRPVLEMLSRGSSANLSALALADGVAMLPPDCVSIEVGGSLRFQPFCDC
jgi:molybdopterin molybdotransferase